ncbi:MAG: hypothetical protein IPM15_02235 [Betaproteobacteria bacterium]|nr:hypothetical protein [Betaproteobacteria bacterium]MCC6250067.1 hypothetical protein [Rubrivivax sp.]
MPTRKTTATRRTAAPRNPELTAALDSLAAAGRHLRNAVQGKVDALRGVAADEIARAKAALLKRTNVAQDRVETVLKTTETRLHKAITGAQKALDRAVTEAEKRSAATAKAAKKATAPAQRAAGGARKTVAKKVAKVAKKVAQAAENAQG